MSRLFTSASHDRSLHLRSLRDGFCKQEQIVKGAGVFVAILLAGVVLSEAAALKISPNSTVRAASEVEGQYTTTHLFVDEVAGDSIPITVFFDPQTLGVAEAQVFTNLNRRDKATVTYTDTVTGLQTQEGIKPPDGDVIAAGDDTHYYKAYAMTGVSGGYQLTLNATKTGAYRLTARYRLTTDPPNGWRYYVGDQFGDLAFRSHALVVSPKKARDMVMYEINTLNIESEGMSDTLRSTFVDLWDGPGSTRTRRWNLDYARSLGINWLWFQPIHPFGIDGRHLSAENINSRNIALGFGNPAATTRFANGSEDVNYPYAFGSPYAVKNFFEIEPRMSKANTRAAAMSEFQAFVNAADNGGVDSVNVMLDAPFNHTSFDAELGAKGVTYFSSGASATDEIRNREARFFSRSGNYAMRASGAGNIALAPDRGDFGKFIDTYDVYWGRYASLVDTNPGGNGNKDSEADWFDYSVGAEGSSGDNNGHFDGITQNVWRYFADYCVFWLDQTGCTAGTSAADQVWKGIDGLRADFGQGIPPQAWEYVINVARNRKWTFTFMAESLDGGAVTYRSARHFDILNENILFGMKGLSVSSNSMTSDFRNLFESRRSSYGQGLVLLNTTSHDEDNYVDPWEPLIRYAACSTIDGVPMIFPGQELGISQLYGYDLLEKNFGKYIPHFKTWNSMMPLWGNSDLGLNQLKPVYSALGRARHASAALRSSNRYFIDQLAGGTHQRVFSVAKYETANGSPATKDVVFGFVNLDRGNNQSGTFNVGITQGGSNLFGIKSGRTYNVRNLAAYTAQDESRDDALLWGAGRAGSDVLANGVFVSLNKVPATNGEWSTTPYEGQFLKLLDTTAPTLTPAQPGGPNPYAYEIGNSVTFTWPAVAADAEGVAPQYRVVVTVNGVAQPAVFTSAASYTVNGTAGQTVSIVVEAVNPNDNTKKGPASAASAGNRLLAAAGDEDGDGLVNDAEKTAGTNPFDPASTFVVSQVERLGANEVRLTWQSVAGKKYEVQAAADIAGTFSAISGPTSINATGASTSYTDSVAGGGVKYYKVRVVP